MFYPERKNVFYRLCMLTLVLYAFFHSFVFAEWESAGTIAIPPYPYTFLAATPNGDLLATTFNNYSDKSVEIPAILIKNPMSATPEVVELCKVSFLKDRGYSGVACDHGGNFYLAGDTGDAATCFLRKFKPDGSPDTTFGNNGVVMPKKRCLGVDVIGPQILLAVGWAQVQVYDYKTGKMIGEFPKTGADPFIRDIAIDPSSMRVYGVAMGGVWVWEGGQPWEPAGYNLREITTGTGSVRAGEGISFDPIMRVAIVTPVPGNTLFEVKDANTITKTVVTSAAPQTHLADSCLSFDGTTLFITDMFGKNIHVLKRIVYDNMSRISSVSPISDGQAASPRTPAPSQPSATTAPASTPPTGRVKQAKWEKSYTDVVQRARTEHKPMVVYFRRDGVSKCVEIESNILLTPEFNSRAPRFICVFEDLAVNPLTAYRLGVFRVPHITIMDSKGDTVERFTFRINADDLFRAMDSAR
jgi:DNA-binding beta-propeller fold protein YncE